MREHLFIALIFIGLAGAAVYFSDAATPETEANYITADVTEGPLQEVVTATGSLQAVVTVEVGSELSGRLSQLLVDFNDVVTKGQPIARLDAKRFEARSSEALTMLGIIIGVASVVTMTAVGAGASNQIQDQIRSLGANVLMINPEAARRDGVHRQGASQRALIDADARAIEAQLAAVSHSVSSVRRSYQLIAGNRNWWTTVNGTQTGYFAIREWPLEAGRYFSAQGQQAGEKIILVGQTVAKRLFGSPAAALDRTIRILNSNFTVIGVLPVKGPAAKTTPSSCRRR